MVEIGFSNLKWVGLNSSGESDRTVGVLSRLFQPLIGVMGLFRFLTDASELFDHREMRSLLDLWFSRLNYGNQIRAQNRLTICTPTRAADVATCQTAFAYLDGEFGCIELEAPRLIEEESQSRLPLIDSSLRKRTRQVFSYKETGGESQTYAHAAL